LPCLVKRVERVDRERPARPQDATNVDEDVAEALAVNAFGEVAGYCLIGGPEAGFA
jgi:hypothetical protein